MTASLFDTLTEENLAKIKRIEEQAYANTCYGQMQNCHSWEDVADYMECTVEQIRLCCGEAFYLLAAEHEDSVEVVDLASADGMANLRRVVLAMESFDKPLTMDCRESTSYPILKYLERIKRCAITEDVPHQWGGEAFHELTVYTTKALEAQKRLDRDVWLEHTETEPGIELD